MLNSETVDQGLHEEFKEVAKLAQGQKLGEELLATIFGKMKGFLDVSLNTKTG